MSDEANDAMRWRFVRTVLAQAVTPHMDGTFTWRFRPLYGRGRTIDEVIDNMIAGGPGYRGEPMPRTWEGTSPTVMA